MATHTEAVAPAIAGAPALIERSISSRIVGLAWPVVVERLSLSVLSLVDIALVGRYVGADGLAAVGIGTLLFWIPLSGALAVDVGSTAVVARDVGAGDYTRVRAGMQTAVIAALAWGIGCGALLFALAPTLMRVMGAEADVQPLGVEFLRAGCFGFPMLTVLYAISGSWRGAGNTWIAMAVIIALNIVNASVTFLLISGVIADLGVRASGIGYAAAGSAGGVMALAIAISPLAPIRFDIGSLAGVSRDALGRLLRIGLPVGLEEAQFMLAFLVYTRIIARLGTDQLAAHSLALRSLELAILPGFALGTAATALVGQQLGARRPDIAEAIARRVRTYAMLTLCVMAVVQFALAPYIVNIFVDDPEVRDTGTKLLRVFAFGLPALGLHSSLAGALRGAGDVRYVLGTMTFTAWGVRVPLAALLVITFGLSVPFAWIAATLEHYVRAALIVRRFEQGKWKTMKV